MLALLMAQIASAYNTPYPVYTSSYSPTPSQSPLAKPVQSNITAPKPAYYNNYSPISSSTPVDSIKAVLKK